MIDPKAAGGTLGAAIGGFVWFLLAKFDVASIGDWSTEEISYSGSTTAVILAFVFAYLIPNRGSTQS